MLKLFLKKLNSLFNLKCGQGLNLLVTLYVNLSQFRFRDAIKFPILVYGKCRVVNLKGKFIFDKKIERGLLVIGITDPVRSFDSTSIINMMGEIHIHGKANIRRGLHIQVNTDALLELGNRVFIADNTTIICSQHISIGKNTRIGNNCTLMDTDFHYIINTETKEVRAASKPIIIGKNNWIAGFNVVKKGAITPEGTIVAGPYSMIGKNYIGKIDNYSIIGGSPAKLIAANYRRILDSDIQNSLHEYFKKTNENYHFSKDMNIDDICLYKN